MATAYTEIPHNWAEMEHLVITDPDKITTQLLFDHSKVFFYDACSFRTHAKLSEDDINPVLTFFQHQNGVIVLTRCILMELASASGVLNAEYIEYIRRIASQNIDIVVMYEEDLFTVLQEYTSSTEKINELLMWSVRMLKVPVSTITSTLNDNPMLKKTVINGTALNKRTVYKDFFSKVRGNKEKEDNLGEELIGICLHILSHISGEPDCKFCIITDDKGAKATIGTLFKNTNKQFAGKNIVVFSTPKLVQTLVKERILIDRQKMIKILSSVAPSGINVLGMRVYHMEVVEMSFTCEDLVDLMLKPGEINIVF